MDLRHYLNNNKLSKDMTTLIGKSKINNPRTENHLHGVRKNRKNKAARRKKKKMMGNQSITSIDEYKKRYEDEKIGLSRVSAYLRLNDNTLNSSMDNLCEEFAVSDQETSDPNIQDISEDDRLKMSEYSELDDNILNPSVDLCEEFAVSNQKTSDLNVQLVCEAGPVRMSEYPGLDNNTFNSSMDHFCKESNVNNQKTLSSSAQATFEAGLSKMSKYRRLDNTFNPSMDLLYKESEINNQTSSSNVQATSEAGPSRISKCSRLDNTLNPSMDHLCKESNVNNQKTLSSSAQATFEASLSKMSKYRRLDNTFNPSMNLLYKESEINNQTSSSNVQATSEAGPSRISKCSRLDNALNPSMDHLCKESEVNETSSSNTPVTSNFFKMAIALMEYPERKLNSNEVSVVRRLVMKHILMSKETCARFPCFYNNTEWHGAIIFNCANKETSEWLSNLTPKLTLDDGVQLRILDIDKLSKYHRAIIYVSESMITKDLLYFLEKQNEGLVTNDWIFFPGNESRDAKNRFVVYFGDSSLEVLKALEFRPFCGLERAVIKLINKEIKKEVEGGNDDLLNKSAVPLF